MPNPGSGQITAALQQVNTIAIVGAKDAPGQPVDRVGRFLMERGYQVVPVHPKRKNVWGLTTYPNLTELDAPVDMVNLFRAKQFCLAHAQESLSLSGLPMIFWMQMGIANPEARSLLEPKNIMVVEDLCLMVYLSDHPEALDGRA